MQIGELEKRRERFFRSSSNSMFYVQPNKQPYYESESQIPVKLINMQKLFVDLVMEKRNMPWFSKQH